ncbi:MAG TPA: hypothetical protein PKH33_01975 [bacterium]|nr:hypothetical protein [bacterium]
MDIITGNAVVGENYLSTRKFLVDDLRDYLLKGKSVLIDSPRRFGKTSVIKELAFQEESQNNIKVLFLDIESEKTVVAFCKAFFRKALSLFPTKERNERLKTFFGDTWNMIAGRVKKIGGHEFELELSEKTRDYDFEKWKEVINALLSGRPTGGEKVVFAFDEFPDLILSLKENADSAADFTREADSLLAWLRSLRQESGQHTFVFCGSINLNYTLDAISARHRINDLERLVVPVMDKGETEKLLATLFSSIDINVEPAAMEFLSGICMGGPPYYGQIVAKEFKSGRVKSIDVETAMGLVDNMICGENHDLRHLRTRMNKLFSSSELMVAKLILKALCGAEAMPEKRIYDEYISGKCDYELFAAILGRLTHEGYVMREPEAGGGIRFVSPLFKKWWASKEESRQ